MFQKSIAKDEYRSLENMNFFAGYQRTDHHFCQFRNYNLTYTFYGRSNPLVVRRPAGYIWDIAHHSRRSGNVLAFFTSYSRCQLRRKRDCSPIATSCGCDDIRNKNNNYYNAFQRYYATFNNYFTYHTTLQFIEIAFSWLAMKAKRKFWLRQGFRPLKPGWSRF